MEIRQTYIGRTHQSYDRVLGNNKVHVIKGFAKFVDAKTVEVNGELYTADHILTAVGGRTKIQIFQAQNTASTRTAFFELSEQPKRVAVIGAGYIAVKIAGVLNALGTETHLFCSKESPLRSFDPKII